MSLTDVRLPPTGGEEFAQVVWGGGGPVLHWVIDLENKHITSSSVFVCHIGVYTISIAQVESVRRRALKDQEEKT